MDRVGHLLSATQPGWENERMDRALNGPLTLKEPPLLSNRRGKEKASGMSPRIVCYVFREQELHALLFLSPRRETQRERERPRMQLSTHSCPCSSLQCLAGDRSQRQRRQGFRSSPNDKHASQTIRNGAPVCPDKCFLQRVVGTDRRETDTNSA